MIRSHSKRALLLAAALLLACCARDGAPPGPDAGAPAPPLPAAASASAATSPTSAPIASAAPVASAAPPPAASASPSAAASAGPSDVLETSILPSPAAEPRRRTIGRLEDEPALVGHRETILKHFKGTLPSPLDLQSIDVAGNRRAWLLLGKPKRRDPQILVLDAQGALLWTKERPLAGIAPEVNQIVIAPGPDGEVALIWVDTPTRLVALRKWASDGGILADFELMDAGSCEALSAMYWPARGWVVAAAVDGAARAQLLDEGGQLSWGDRGLGLPWASRGSAPVSIAADTDGTVMLLQVGRAEGATGKPGERVLAARYNAPGTSLWAKPVDLGPAPPGARSARIAASRAGDAVIRVTLGTGPSRLAVDITSEGATSPARKPARKPAQKPARKAAP